MRNALNVITDPIRDNQSNIDDAEAVRDYCLSLRRQAVEALRSQLNRTSGHVGTAEVQKVLELVGKVKAYDEAVDRLRAIVVDERSLSVISEASEIAAATEGEAV